LKRFADASKFPAATLFQTLLLIFKRPRAAIFKDFMALKMSAIFTP
jgi:hypothetical protein